MENFVDRLIDEILSKNCRLVVGLDPHFELLPSEILEGVEGSDRKSVAERVFQFGAMVIKAVAPIVPAIKIQVAFYERLGPPGITALEETVKVARDAGLLVISDAKRGDIGSTAAAYASYHIGVFEDRAVESLGADCVTVNPYFGKDGLEPFLRYVRLGKGIFILVRTSNPDSVRLQDVTVSAGKFGGGAYYKLVAEVASELGRDTIGRHGYSAVGIVVGATQVEQSHDLRQMFPELFFLVPGYGAQGATAEDVAWSFGPDGVGAIVNASRSILFAYRNPKFEKAAKKGWHEACRAAAISARDEINESVLGSAH